MTTPINPLLPANYDAVDLWIYPNNVFQTATTLNTLITDISDELSTLMTTLSGLQLGWAGTTATEAQDFFTQWGDLMTDMFGTQSDATSGVILALLQALQNAAADFGIQEQYVTGLFLNMMTSPPTGTTTTPVPNDQADTAVWEDPPETPPNS